MKNLKFNGESLYQMIFFCGFCEYKYGDIQTHYSFDKLLCERGNFFKFKVKCVKILNCLWSNELMTVNNQHTNTIYPVKGHFSFNNYDIRTHVCTFLCSMTLTVYIEKKFDRIFITHAAQQLIF